MLVVGNICDGWGVYINEVRPVALDNGAKLL